MIFQKGKRILLALIATLFLVSALHAQTKLLRFPDVRGDKVVFTHGGDLWLASTFGGLASRLTAHPGLELFAKFSSDGKWISFTGLYDGDEQVYIIPLTGGVPKQLTFYPARGALTPRWGYDNQVYGWTPDGKSVRTCTGKTPQRHSGDLPPPSAARNLSCDLCQATPSRIQRLHQRAQSVPKNLYSDAHQQE
jgi:tricorn protease-like protein